MTQAIILDLDGTLLDRQRAVSDASRAVLGRCREAGILLIIATARPLRTAQRCLPADLRDDFLVLCNGAWIVRQGEVILRDELPPAVVRKVVERLRELGYVPAVEANDCFYTDGEREPGFAGSYFPLGDYPDVAACKVLAYAKQGLDAQCVRRSLDQDVSCVITDNQTLLQISAPTCSKLTACTAILRREGISLADTCAFGDDNNDISLLEAVGCGVAMANGTVELRRVAKHVTGSHDNDGVAKGISQYVLAPRDCTSAGRAGTSHG